MNPKMKQAVLDGLAESAVRVAAGADVVVSFLPKRETLPADFEYLEVHAAMWNYVDRIREETEGFENRGLACQLQLEWCALMLEEGEFL
jgi:hypothetical protein